MYPFFSAHLAFGTKVGAEIPTLPPTSAGSGSGSGNQVSDSDSDSDSDSNSVYSPNNDRPALPVRTLRKRPQITIQTTAAPPPPKSTSAPSTRHQTNSVNDQLPFYKEPGGIFEHPKFSNSQIESNEIQFNKRLPVTQAAVKYAPKVCRFFNEF